MKIIPKQIHEKPREAAVLVNMNKELRRAFERYCETEGISMARQARIVLAEFLNREGVFPQERIANL